MFSVASSIIRGQPMPLEVNGLEARREIWSLLTNSIAQNEESRITRLRQSAQRMRIQHMEAAILRRFEAGEDPEQARTELSNRDMGNDDTDLAADRTENVQRLDQLVISHQLVNLAALDYVEVGD